MSLHNENETLPSLQKKVALFPGQGSQSPGMGKSLFENFSIARLVFEEASDYSKVDLKKLCFEGDEKELGLTENTQPALLAVSVAAFQVAEKEWGFIPDAVAGHSLGEYSACVAAGAIPLSIAIQMVRERGKSMQAAVPVGVGGMTALLGLSDETVNALCLEATRLAKLESKKNEGPSEIVTAANFNAPEQVVISGTILALECAEKLLKEDAFKNQGKAGKAIRLPVSAPFHSPLMTPTTQHMKDVFSRLSFQKANELICPILPNATARLHQESSAVLDLLLTQIESPVLWKQSMETFKRHEYTTFIEFGSGKVLQGLGKRCFREGQYFGVSDKESIEANPLIPKKI